MAGQAGAEAVRFADDEEDPWPTRVDGAQLLDLLADVLHQHVVLPPGGAEAVALWILHSHALDAADTSAILAITSPVKRCGKTTLLSILAALVRRALPASNISPAAVFRMVQAYGPTLLVDEADTFLLGDDALRGVLDSGHTRAMAYTIRNERQPDGRFAPMRFSTWGAKAIALIGALPPTLADRSIVVPLQRKLKRERVHQWSVRHAGNLSGLRRMAARWVMDNLAALEQAEPAMPEWLHDRAADHWRPLLAIAALEANRSDADDVVTLLLTDLLVIFAARGEDKLSSASICEALAAMEERPWATLQHGKPITPHKLGRLLVPFGVRPVTVRLGARTAKGYMLASLQPVCKRYLGDDKN